MRLIVPLYEAEAIRPFLSGKFGDLLRNATAHPAMLIYLDQADSLGPDSAGGIPLLLRSSRSCYWPLPAYP